MRGPVYDGYLGWFINQISPWLMILLIVVNGIVKPICKWGAHIVNTDNSNNDVVTMVILYDTTTIDIDINIVSIYPI